MFLHNIIIPTVLRFTVGRRSGFSQPLRVQDPRFLPNFPRDPFENNVQRGKWEARLLNFLNYRNRIRGTDTL